MSNYRQILFTFKDALKHKNHPNMKIIWYEDLTTNFDEEVRGLSEFTGYKLSEENMTVKAIINIFYGRKGFVVVFKMINI